jgi:hypothetical protein
MENERRAMRVIFPFVVGMALLSFMFFILVLSTIGFGMGIPLAPLHIWLSVGGSFIVIFITAKFYDKHNQWKYFLGAGGLSVLLMCCFMYVSGMFYDISYDGQVYHQEAVIQLANHWNPFQQYLTKEQSQSAVLLNHYAKGPWIYEAALYTVTGQIEESKAFNFLLMAASFLLAFSAMRNSGRYSVKQAMFFSLLLALNPVSMYQALSFYLDGQLASLLLCLVALSYQMVMYYDKIVLFGFVMSISLLVNVKFTGIVYGVACIGLLGGWLWLLQQKQAVWKLGKTAILGLVAGICILGYNPYMTNSFFYGHPFYPLYGGGPKSMDIMTSNSPKGFLQLSGIQKLYVANFSMATNQFDTEEPVVKFPFRVTAQELKPFVYGADIRIGGFGPWFSGMVVLGGLIVFLLAISPKKETLFGMGMVASILLSALINPESWWARYVPQIWLAFICLAMVAELSEKKAIGYLGRALAGAAVINLALIAYPYFLGNYYCSQALKQELKEIAANHNPINVCFGEFTSNYLRFTKNNISFVDAPADIADINIDVIRYKYLTAAGKEEALANIFAKEGMEENEQ